MRETNIFVLLFIGVCSRWVRNTYNMVNIEWVTASISSREGNLRISKSNDNHCFDMALKYPHKTVPTVGFSIQCLGSSMYVAYYLNLRVRDKEINKTTVPAVLRIPKRVDNWRMVQFTIVVSSRPDTFLYTFRLGIDGII